MKSGRLPQSVEWSVHMCLVLALLADDEVLPAQRLADLYELPAAYLAKAMQDLATAGIVESVPGRRGGYRLSAAPADIPVGRIVRAAGLAGSLFVCTEIRQRGPYGARPEQCLAPCEVAALMGRAQDAYLRELDAVSLADLVVPARRKGAEAWFTGNVHRIRERS